MPLDRILFIPSYIPPLKGILSVSPQHRFRMAEIAVKYLPSWIVSDIEIRKKGVSYTHDTIAELKKKYPYDSLFWIVGVDNVLSMNEWKGGYGLLDECQFIVVPRAFYSFDSIPSAIRKKVIIQHDFPSFPFSSTTIRALLREGSDASTFLPEKVYAYIKKYKFYEKKI